MTGTPIVVMGLGEIGLAIARAAVARPGLSLIAAVDADPALSGRSLDELLGGGSTGLTVASDLSRALAEARGGVLLHAAGSRFDAVLPHLEQAVRAGVHVVSTCEELAWPWLQHEEQADALDRLCEERSVAVVGTGVNPGFVLDRLPAVFAQVTGAIRHVRGLRVVDLARRRPALQRKAGAGLTEEAFDAAYERGEVGHVGLAESAAMAAAACGVEWDELDEDLVPLVAEEDAGAVQAGRVAGIHQVARMFAEGQEVVRLELTLQVGADDPRDEVELDADPPLRLVVPGGVSGDAATANAVVNAVAAVLERQGLLTVLDLPSGR